MIVNAPQTGYTEYKLYRQTEHDNFDLRGKLPNGKWGRIYSQITINDYFREVVLTNLGVDIMTIKQITRKATK